MNWNMCISQVYVCFVMKFN